MQANSLLADDDGANIRACREFQDMVDRVADDHLDPLAFQYFGNSFSGFHLPLPCFDSMGQ